jgi:DNA-binding MarR family transcriptional regulator
MTRIAGKLGNLGLIERETDVADRRVSRIRISPAGRKLLERTRSRRTAYLAKRLRTLTPGERDTLTLASGLLQRLVSEDRA